MTNLMYSHPRNYGKDSRHCRVCHTTRGLIRKYHLDMCRRCFRERATQIGFVKALRRKRARAHAMQMHMSSARWRCTYAQLLLITLLLVACNTLLHAAHTFELESDRDASSSTGFLSLERVSQQPAARYSTFVRRAVTIEVPSQQQRDAIVTESPTLLQARSQRSERLFTQPDGTTAQVDGRGRADRPPGISITRGLPLTASTLPHRFDADSQRFAVDDMALAFDPPELDMGSRATCEPVLWHVTLVNRGAGRVRLDAIEFSRGGFELLSDLPSNGAVNAMELVPAAHATLAFTFTPSVVDTDFEAFLRVFTSSGQFALRITASVMLHPFGVRGVRAIVPLDATLRAPITLYNPFHEVLRVADVFTPDAIGSIVVPALDDPATIAQTGGPRVGVWDVAPGETRTIADFTFTAADVGVVFTTLQVVTTSQQLLSIPFTLEIVPRQLHFEPPHIDFGILTAFDAVRQAVVDLYNAADEAIAIEDVSVASGEGLNVTVTLLGPLVLPPQTRVKRALLVQASAVERSNHDSSMRNAVVTLQTNATVGSATIALEVTATHIDGAIAFAFNETLVGVSHSLATALSGKKKKERTTETPARLQTLATFDSNASTVVCVAAGTSIVRSLQLRNLYNVPLELERVWVDSDASSVDHTIVAIERFVPGVATSGATWPIDVRLRISVPADDDSDSDDAWSFGATRVVHVVVETNVVTVRIPVFVFSGVLQLRARDGAYSVTGAGYHYRPPRSTTTTPTKRIGGRKPPPRECLPIDPDADDKSDTSHAPVKLCRLLQLDFGRVARFQLHTTTLTLSNTNPIALNVQIASLLRSELYDVVIQSLLTPALQAADAVAAIGRQPHYTNATSNASRLDGVATMHDVDDTAALSKAAKAQLAKLHDVRIVPPGFDFELTLGVRMRDAQLGAFTKFLLTLETPREVVHVYARFESVAGAVAPLLPMIQAPPAFPGAVTLVALEYLNTFAHDVRVTALSFPATSVQIVAARDVLPAGDGRSGHAVVALNLLFSPAYSDACVNSSFLADCALPRLDAAVRASPLSDYGAIVTLADVLQLQRRQTTWDDIDDRRRLFGTTEPHVDATVVLHSTMMDAAPVRIVAPLARAAVTRANASEPFVTSVFPLTRVGERRKAFVSVRNPSSVPRTMELAVSVLDHTMFYTCVVGDDDSVSDDDAACLDAWAAAVAATANDPDAPRVAPFYVATSRVVSVAAGATVELGPVYFLPSQAAAAVNATVYVRNELTHIEPVTFSASSGIGSLGVRVVPFAALEEEEEEEKEERSGAVKDTATIAFTVDARDASSFEAHAQTLELRNSGSYDLRIQRIGFAQRSSSDSAGDDAADAALNRFAGPFRVHIDRMRRNGDSSVNHDECDDQDARSIVVAPHKRVTLRVVFAPHCVAASTTHTLVVVTDVATVRFTVNARADIAASFACLRAQLPPVVHTIALVQWQLVIALALLVGGWSVRSILCDVSQRYRRERAIRTAAALMDPRTRTLSSLPLEALHETNGASDDAMATMLDTLEATTFAPVTHVATPAVTRLLLERQRRAAKSAMKGGASVAVVETAPAVVETTPQPPVHTASSDGLNNKAALADTELLQAPAIAPAPSLAAEPAALDVAAVLAVDPSIADVASLSSPPPPQTLQATTAVAVVTAAPSMTPRASKAAMSTPATKKKKKKDTTTSVAATAAAVAVDRALLLPLNGAAQARPVASSSATLQQPTRTSKPAAAAAAKPATASSSPIAAAAVATKTNATSANVFAQQSSPLPRKCTERASHLERGASLDAAATAAAASTTTSSDKLATRSNTRRKSPTLPVAMPVASTVESPQREQLPQKTSTTAPRATATARRAATSAQSLVSPPPPPSAAAAAASKRIVVEASRSTLLEERTSDKTVVALTKKRGARPSSGNSRNGTNRRVQLVERLDASVDTDALMDLDSDVVVHSLVSPTDNIDSYEPVDVLASSIDSTRSSSTTTTVPFDADARAKRSLYEPIDAAPHGIAASDDAFLLSMTFEAPFSSSFGAIGKRRTPASHTTPPSKQQGRGRDDAAIKCESPDDDDVVLVHRLEHASPVATRTLTPPHIAPNAVASIHTDDAIEDDWSDLYFDSIRSEIGRLVASSSNDASNDINHQRMRPHGFASLHAQQLTEPRVFGRPSAASASAMPAGLTTAAASTAQTTKAAPPGFSPADANPLASFAAFERLRTATSHTSMSSLPASTAYASAALSSATDIATPTDAANSSRFAFASRLSLFGPSLASSQHPPLFRADSSPVSAETEASVSPSSFRSLRSISNSDDAVTPSADWMTTAALLDAHHRPSGAPRTALASLGGVELVSPAAVRATSTANGPSSFSFS